VYDRVFVRFTRILLYCSVLVHINLSGWFGAPIGTLPGILPSLICRINNAHRPE
jgi:hypothetical protein